MRPHSRPWKQLRKPFGFQCPIFFDSNNEVANLPQEQDQFQKEEGFGLHLGGDRANILTELEPRALSL